MNPLAAIGQTEDEVLSGGASDEALERAAVARAAAVPGSFSFCTSVYVCPWWSPPAASGRGPR
ncbi:MAG: hypothetical protein P8Y71_02160 [Pseudolabrys sp.]